ncbi:MAG: hypothetical protein DHS80DRAFT_32939 [Piptocephalis tieghemiana]|nr:MAG: hypothetical protein DHS80DRAFT_32939 [Piptocephalis tieghemiana]
MTLLDHASFFQQLDQQIATSHTSGTFTLTMKRLKQSKHDASPALGKDAKGPDSDQALLVRSVSKRSKISTVVLPEDAEAFHSSLAPIMRQQMNALKKKDRSKDKARKALKKHKQRSSPTTRDEAGLGDVPPPPTNLTQLGAE